MTHTAIDRRSLMMHRIIAERLRADPALLEIARGNMARWNCPERGWWREWSGILQQPLEDILSVLERDDEEGCRLRQSSPFAGILSPQEVWKLKRKFKESGSVRGVGSGDISECTAHVEIEPSRNIPADGTPEGFAMNSRGWATQEPTPGNRALDDLPQRGRPMHAARTVSALANPAGVQRSLPGLSGGRATPGYSWRTPPGFLFFRFRYSAICVARPALPHAPIPSSHVHSHHP